MKLLIALIFIILSGQSGALSLDDIKPVEQERVNTSDATGGEYDKVESIDDEDQ